jgi:hypothetical protein
LQTEKLSSREPFSIDLPSLPPGNWNKAHVQLDRRTGTHSLRNTTTKPYLGIVNSWYPRKIDYLDFFKVETIRQDGLQVVSHHDFNLPALIKIASFPWEIPDLERENEMYRLLHGSGATPEFLGHVTSTIKMVRITLAAALACKLLSSAIGGGITRSMLTHSVAVSVMALALNNAGAKDVGNGKGQQFTTGGCVADADCRSACGAEISGSGLGICSAIGAQHQNGKLGCGFDNPNAAIRTALHSVLYTLANKISSAHRCCQGSVC